MQVNDSVKVKAGEHSGRAGTIIGKIDEENFEVRLDANQEQEKVDVAYAVSDLERLG